MKKLLFVLLLALTANLSFAAPSQYVVDDQKVESLFQNSNELEASSINEMLASGTAGPNGAQFQNGDSPIVALILAWALGYLGIHRAYLGTKALVVVGYILTCGGLGILWTIDYILLFIGVINDDVSDYEDNPSFFMWR